MIWINSIDWGVPMESPTIHTCMTVVFAGAFVDIRVTLPENVYVGLSWKCITAWRITFCDTPVSCKTVIIGSKIKMFQFPLWKKILVCHTLMTNKCWRLQSYSSDFGRWRIFGCQTKVVFYHQSSYRRVAASRGRHTFLICIQNLYWCEHTISVSILLVSHTSNRIESPGTSYHG